MKSSVDRKIARIVLWIFVGIVALIVIIPALLYVPPVQQWVKDIALTQVNKSTGMHIDCGRFSLRFPLRIELDDVMVALTPGDTMVTAQRAALAVKPLPLLKLDIAVDAVELENATYQMGTPDSAMWLTARVGRFDLDMTDLAIKRGRIDVGTGVLDGGEVMLVMRDTVTPTPTDTAKSAVDWRITARRLELRNVTYRMQMLPTIDSLGCLIERADLDSALVDMAPRRITARSLEVKAGNIAYLLPDSAWLAAHPARELAPDTAATAVSDTAGGWTILADRIELRADTATYAVRNARPLPGLDMNYLEASAIEIAVDSFYNCATEIVVPLRRLSARERCGIALKADGTFDMLRGTMHARNFNIATDYSTLRFDAAMGLGDLAADPDLPLSLRLDGQLALEDAEAALPMLTPMLRGVPRTPARLNADIEGTTGNLAVNNISASIARFFNFGAKGRVSNPFDPDRMDGSINLNVSASGLNAVKPTLLEAKLASQINLPPTTLNGSVTFKPATYGGRLTLASSGGTIGLNGSWQQKQEGYDATLAVKNFPVDAFMPSLGVGRVTATLKAKGHGYNPLSPRTNMDVQADVTDIAYAERDYRNITLNANLTDGHAKGELRSVNTDADIDLGFTATVADSGYTWDLNGRVNNLDLGAMKLTAAPMQGSLAINSTGTCDPTMKSIDAKLQLSDLRWVMATDMVINTKQVDLGLNTTDSTLNASLTNGDLNATVAAGCGLDSLMARFTATSALIDSAMRRRSIDIEQLQRTLPKIAAIVNFGNKNVAAELMAERKITFDHGQISMRNDSLLDIGAIVLGVKTASANFDTVSAAIAQHGKFLAYTVKAKSHPGSNDNFADVGLSGFIGSDRLTALARQTNTAGQQGFMLGLSAMMADSTITVRFVPYNPTVGYKKWTLNRDNFIRLNFVTKHIDANLAMQNDKSYIKIFTEHDEAHSHDHEAQLVPDSLATVHSPADEQEDIIVQISDIHLADWLAVSMFAPPIKGDLNADLRFHWNASEITGRGNAQLNNLYYGRDRVGSFGVDIDVANSANGSLHADLALMVDSVKVITATGHINDSTATEPFMLDFSMIRFPLQVVNPFLPKEYARLSGTLNGQMDVTGSVTAPIFNGYLDFDSTAVKVGMLGASFAFSEERIPVDSNIVNFNNFAIRGANDNPLKVNGKVDARHLMDIRYDLGLQARNMQLVNTNRPRSGADVYGRVFVDIDAKARGDMSLLDVDASLAILSGTNVTYIMEDAAAAITSQSSEGMVHFVNFNDTTQVASADSLHRSAMAMNLNANLNVQTGTTINVYLSTDGGNRVTINGNGELSYAMSPLNDGTLTGRFNLNSGNFRYSIPAIPHMNFNFQDGSYVAFNGDMMNPTLHVLATELVKASVSEGGRNSRLVDFLVSLNVGGSLQQLDVAFDLSTDNDITVQNELSSMSPQQRANQAMMLLATGTYTGMNSVTEHGGIGMGNVYSYLTGQLNNWLSNNVKAVDISFGVDQYSTLTDGASGTTTSYSYRVSKSLFNDRFKIIVGGNYSTDDNADENFQQNLINDISFEYMLNRSGSMIIRIFRHTGYESILEGEVTQTGVGFVYKHKLGSLRDMFRFLRRRRRSPLPPLPAQPAGEATLPASVPVEPTQPAKK